MTRPRTVVVAPDKFKGSLGAGEVAGLVAGVLRDLDPTLDVVEHPIADGGEGTVDVAVLSGLTPVTTTVRGPLGQPVEATYALGGSTAVIEMASAAGLKLLGTAPSTQSAGTASTYGVGQLVADALNRGARRIVLGLGGSATTDGGAGLVSALGVRVLDPDGQPIAPGGLGLAQATRVDASGIDPRLAQTEVILACDVDNPLCGPQGAAAVYGPQKGADPGLVEVLDSGLTRWADVVRRDRGSDRRAAPGAGAAGGAGFALLMYAGAELVPGVDILLELSGFADIARDADLLIVGEGSLDAQSLHGKGPVGLIRWLRAQPEQRLVPVVAIVGRNQLTQAQANGAGMAAVYAMTDLEKSIEVCMADSVRLTRQLAGQVAGDWLTTSHRSGA